MMSVHVNVGMCQKTGMGLLFLFFLFYLQYSSSFFLLVYHDAGSSDVMGDLEYECLEKTDLALREERLHGDVDMTV